MNLESKMLNQDPNHIFMSIMGNVVGTICAVPVIALQNIDLVLKIALSIVGLTSYILTIKSNMRNGKDNNKSKQSH